MAVSFLDNLKKQADNLRTHHGVSTAALEARIEETEQACQLAFKYWLDLAKQLNVLQPPCVGRYLFDNKVVIEQPPFSHFRADLRKRSWGGRDVTDHAVLFGEARTGRTVSLTKNFPIDIEKLEARLTQSGVQCTPEPVRNPDTGKLIEVRYEFLADVLVSARLRPLHEEAKVEFTVDNVDGLIRWVVEFDSREVDSALLDEMAKWLVGHPHQFTQRGKVLHLRES